MSKTKEENELGSPMFQTEKPAERKSMLEANAYAVEEQLVRKAFTKEELDNFKEELSQCSIDLKNKQATAKKQMQEIRETLRIAEEARKDRVSKLQTGFEESLQQVYLFDDQKRRKMIVYDQFGEVVNERPLLPRERQTSIVSIAKTGTND